MFKTIHLRENVCLRQIELFEPSKDYMNYILVSKSGDISININCVNKNADLNLGQEFSQILLYDSEPEVKPPILSMEVKLVSVGSGPNNVDGFFKFEGVSRPYSEISVMANKVVINDAGKVVGKVFYVGIS